MRTRTKKKKPKKQEKLFLVVEERTKGEEFRAYFRDHVKHWESGKSAEEAIGKLVRSYPELFSVELHVTPSLPCLFRGKRSRLVPGVGMVADD